MKKEQQNRSEPNLRRSQWLAAWATPLAIFGVLLPYAVAIVPIVLFRREIRSHDFYLAGKLATFNMVTGWLTVAALVLGIVPCWPWLQISCRAAESRILWVAGIAVVAFIEFVAVFTVRFWLYVSSGGTFP